MRAGNLFVGQALEQLEQIVSAFPARGGLHD
jgi:hypothetical protein